MTIRRALRYHFHRIVRATVRVNDSPRQIAGGVAIGVLVSFTPAMGLQTISAALIATMFRCSRIPAVIFSFILNPFTAFPIYGASYFLGAQLMKPFGFQPLAFERVRQLFVRPEDVGFWRMIRIKLVALFGLSWNGLAPLLLGCLVLGLFAAGAMYYLALRFITGHRLLKAQRMALRAKRRLERVRLHQQAERRGGAE
jgi:hypothetical protein